MYDSEVTLNDGPALRRLICAVGAPMHVTFTFGTVAAVLLIAAPVIAHELRPTRLRR